MSRMECYCACCWKSFMDNCVYRLCHSCKAEYISEVIDEDCRHESPIGDDYDDVIDFED